MPRPAPIPAEASAPVAQLDRAPDYESGGQEFESLRARHQLIDIDSEFLRDFCRLDIAFVGGSTGATRIEVASLRLD
jgi:hypothetical protein